MSAVRMVGLLLRFQILQLVNYLFRVMRNVVWRCNGTTSAIFRNQHGPDRYSQSGHRMKIWAKFILDMLAPVGVSNFFLVHDGFVHPEYTLRDEVTLLQITEKEAIFVERRKESDPPHSVKFNFFLFGQFQTADRIITIPIYSFIRLAAGMKDVNEKIVLLYNQSRCGSTLLASILENTGRCITLSEPQAFNACCFYIERKIWQGEQANQMLKGVTKVLCKPYSGPNEKPLAYVIKPLFTCVFVAETIQKIIPQSVPLFLYRNPIAVSQSIVRLAEAIPMVKLFFLLVKLIPGITAKLQAATQLVNTPYLGWSPKSKQASFELSYMTTVFTNRSYLMCKECGLHITALRYEDLAAFPVSIITQVLDLCGIPRSLLPQALQAMEVDSQEAMPFSRARLHKIVPFPPKPSKQLLDVLQTVSLSNGVPGPEEWSDDFRLPGSILP